MAGNNPLPAWVNKLLESFQNTRYCDPPKRTFHTGYSAAMVVVAHFEPLAPNGLRGDYIVKITSEEEARHERDFFRTFPDGALPDAFAPPKAQSDNVSNGMVAVAYDIAYESIMAPQTLREVLEKDVQHVDLVEKAIGDLAQTLCDWYQQPGEAPERSVQSVPPHTFLCSMIGADKLANLTARLISFLSPAWSTATAFEVIGLERRLPNPVVYLEESAWERFNTGSDWTGITCQLAPIHGDLHAGNVMCLLNGEHPPMLIDFGSCALAGSPLFDLAYLEYDIMRRSLPVHDLRNREQWLFLLDFCMKEIMPTSRPRGALATQTWRYIKPLREVVRQAIAAKKDDEEAWWIATVAVGLNFARKGRTKRPPYERESALLYAAYGLERLLALQRANVTYEPAGVAMEWLKGQSAAIPSLPIDDALIKQLAGIILHSSLSVERLEALYAACAPDDALGQLAWRIPQATTPTEYVYPALRRLAEALPPDTTDRTAIPPLLRFASMLVDEKGVSTKAVNAWLSAAAAALGIDHQRVPGPVKPRPHPVQAPPAAPEAAIVVLVSPVPAPPKRYDLKAWLFVRKEPSTPEDYDHYLLEAPDEPVKASALKVGLQRLLQDCFNVVDIEPPVALSTKEKPIVELILPRELYELEVETWRMDDGASPLGVRNRLVIRALDRLSGLSDAARKRMNAPWMEKWERLNDAEIPAEPDPVCWITEYTNTADGLLKFSDKVYVGTQSADVICLALDFTPPARAPGIASGPLGGALINGIPAMIWLRTKTSGALDSRITEALRDLVTQQRLSELPALVLQNRRDAASAGADIHLGRYLTLLWDNPHRAPPLGLQGGHDEGRLRL